MCVVSGIEIGLDRGIVKVVNGLCLSYACHERVYFIDEK